MKVTIQIPDDVAERLIATGADIERRVIEALGADEYRAGRLTKPELRRILGFATRYELDGFLKEREIYEDYTMEDVESECADLERLFGFSELPQGKPKS